MFQKTQKNPLEEFLKSRVNPNFPEKRRNFQAAKTQLEKFLLPSLSFPPLRNLADVSDHIRNFQVQKNQLEVKRNEALQKAQSCAADILDSLAIYQSQSDEVERQLWNVHEIAQLPEEAVKLQSQAEAASNTADFLSHVAACISLTEQLRNPQEFPGPAEAALFADLRRRVAQLPASRSQAVLAERRYIILQSLRLGISRSIEKHLAESQSWPSTGAAGDAASGFAAVAAAEALVLLQGVGESEISNIWAAECLCKPWLEKFRVQFGSRDSPLFRLDKPEWPLRRLLEIFVECEELLARWGASDLLRLRLAMELVAEARRFFGERWSTLQPSLFPLYATKFVHASYEWAKVDARVSHELMKDFSDNKLFRVGLLDWWIQADKDYFSEQLSSVKDMFAISESGVSRYANVVIELLTASLPRLICLTQQAKERLVSECYNHVIVEIVLKKFRTNWNEMPGGLSSVEKACILANSLEVIAEHLQGMRLDVPTITQEPSRILLHMISRVHQHLHEAFSDCKHRLFSDPAAFRTRVCQPLLDPYQKHLAPSSWTQLQGYLKTSLDDELVEYISTNGTKDPQLLANCHTNIEALPFDLPKTSSSLASRLKLVPS